ncbi:uroporphyrin-III C-methyltransferase [Cylindrobasidium torrendii FP15055 ss-10]|uniref:precorrin-2 dehydrogenase n=1 Tax=Cylindrobasidium torrendii FP15055 ss-10 TaxID=1314674 RepID=A0A0D7B611_9AGAR|nr:uroporphyrin-III C-methyltransferase [Cylindrobasidium torrendii FP15055 ss-10]
MYPTPAGGASLLLSFRLLQKSVVILGTGTLAASRAFAALEADANVLILKSGPVVSQELQWRADQGQLSIVDLDNLPSSSSKSSTTGIEAFIDSTPGISLFIVTDTVASSDILSERRTRESAEHIYNACHQRNIPVNTTDMPDLCDFTFTSSHRFNDPETGNATPLQIGVTTNGQGCRLAGRLRREIVSKLPKEAGAAVRKVGQMRTMLKDSGASEDCFEDSGISTPNRPVPLRSPRESAAESAKRRMKWVAQVSEYWPLAKLAALTAADMDDVLEANEPENPMEATGLPSPPSMHGLTLKQPGRILLVGSGPGHPSLLTQATYNALTKHAHLVLSDKLVPDAVLQIIPPHVEVRIAKKFPGNADGAQNEMMEAAVEAARRGLTVVRLKQGDPVVYGRAGEEVLYFRSHGFESLVIPGVSSALAGPLFAGIPVTQRGAAESFMVCTGVGRKGRDVVLPAYERGKTLVVLMGVARLKQVIETLTSVECERRNGPAYPRHTPIALIERASMPDQRVIESTLDHIEMALESSGEQRPPGMLVIGWSVLSLWKEGDVTILDEDGSQDDARVSRWLGEHRWRVREGLDHSWDLL